MVNLPLFLGVAREFLSPSTLEPRPTELLLLATLAAARGILEAEEDLLVVEEEEEEEEAPLDLPGLVCTAGTWSWLLLILCGAWLWLSAPPDSLLWSQDLRILSTLSGDGVFQLERAAILILRQSITEQFPSYKVNRVSGLSSDIVD